MFQAKTADELIAWLREHASHQNFLYEGETTILLAEIDRLRARVAELEVEAAGSVPSSVPTVKPDRG